MELIKLEEFRIWQPGYPEIDETEGFYCNLANSLYAQAVAHTAEGNISEKILKRLALCLTAYLQDVVADAGIWRSFVEANRELYGWSVPFHLLDEDYVDYELNKVDVRFLTWYVISMYSESKRYIYPYEEELLTLADACYETLESIYDAAPVAESFHIARGLELYDPEDREDVYRLGQWLYLHCYLMVPAYVMTLSEIMSDTELKEPKNATLLHSRLEQSMMQDPTGPLALYIPEWLYLIIKGKLPKRDDKQTIKAEEDIEHPYYRKFVTYTRGKSVAYFDTYESMNKFFIEALGWEKGEEHLPMMKGDLDFVLMVNREKGMLAARNVARCIADPENPYYDKEYARNHAFTLLTERGLCPGDLLRYILSNGWLPDACFPGTDDCETVKSNADFIARCYLQQYYRGD